MFAFQYIALTIHIHHI